MEDLEPARYEISRIGAFGMTNILGGLQEATRFMPRIDAAYKHIVLISDGKETETGTDYGRVLTQLDAQKVTLSTIAVGPNPNTKLMNTLAHAGKGRFHHAKSLDEIPSAVLREAQGMEDDLLGQVPQQARKLQDDPALAGVDVDKLPPLLGYNRARARTHAWTPLVISPRNEPLLARMRYGRGQSLAFLSSAGPRWAGPWIAQQPAQYAAFWRQAVASVLPPPYQPLKPQVTYQDGRPVFNFSSGLAEGLLKAVTAAESGVAPLEMKDQLPVSDSRAVLASQTGKSLNAFGWSRTYGREFDDPAKGLAAMEQLCNATGGVFRPQEQQIVAPAASGGSLTLSPPGVPDHRGRSAGHRTCGAAVSGPGGTAQRRRNQVRTAPNSLGWFARGILAVLAVAVSAHAMEVTQQGTKLIVTGGAFRYTWDSRRGGELAVVEQKAFSPNGWWLAGTNPRPQPPWQRVNGTFAFKSLDTIPALSFSSLRGAYFSGDWKIAYANADRDGSIKILRQTPDEVVFETNSNPRIVENRREPIPWKVRQIVRVFDSGVILTDLEITLPKGEVYELDWAQMGMFLDDSLLKEPHPDRPIATGLWHAHSRRGKAVHEQLHADDRRAGASAAGHRH